MSSVAEAPLLSDRAVIGTYDPTRRPPQSFGYAPPPSHGPVSYTLLSARWFQPVVQRLVDLTRLPRNWDSYGGVAVMSANATDALWFLARFLESASVPPWVVPLSDGGVQLEWHRDGVDLEVVFSAEGNEFALTDAAHDIAWEGDPETALRQETLQMFRPVLGVLRAE
jgi:hypothetical protein